MSKLRLSLDALEVTSFVVAREDAARGTVYGQSVLPVRETEFGCDPNAPTYYLQCTGPTCDQTLALSCIEANCHSDGLALCPIAP